jgi:Uma2 family endonuclease
MSHLFVRPDSYTYADYYSWPDGIQGELLDGQFYVREPGPSFRHQRVADNLFVQIHTFFDGKPCIAISAPLDVRLPRPGDDDGAERDVVQPDIAVIGDRKKIDDRGCRGAPDWVIEVLSPGSRDRDLTVKRDLYERSGVRLYWIVSPQKRHFTVLRLGENGRYGPGPTTEGAGRHAVPEYPGLIINWDRVFAD